MTTTLTFDPWVTFPQQNPQAHLRLFCFPYAGGGASIYRNWADKLPASIEVCPIQLPGRETRLKEPLFTQLSLLLQVLAPVLHPYLDRPFAFFGHSMGALISFELARQLRRQYGFTPVHLFISGRRVPQLPSFKKTIHQLPTPEFIEELRCLNGTPEVVLQNAELMQLVMPALRADFALCETYVYSNEEPLDCPISAFGGLQDSRVSCVDLAGWRDHTSRAFALEMFPGDHFFLQSARSLILSVISQELTQHLS